MYTDTRQGTQDTKCTVTPQYTRHKVYTDTRQGTRDTKCTLTPDKVHETQGTHRHNTRYTRHKVYTDTRQGAQSHWVSTETPDKVGRDREKDGGDC